MIKKLKTRKSADGQGWVYEVIKQAGGDLDRSIHMMMNILLKNQYVPDEWKSIIIYPIDKGTGWLEMEEKRGLFLTNILSKCMEKVLLDRRAEEIEGAVSRYQTGGLRGRSIQDNLYILNNLISQYKKEKKELYILFADVKKCFDNLWLRDCITELYTRSKVPLQEIYYIYKMNINIKAKVKTPGGMTNIINLKEVVRQGTVGVGVTLCGVSTDRINMMVKYEMKDDIKYPVFVDDVAGGGDKETMREMNEKMQILEVTKKIIFSTKKGKTEWMKIGGKKEEEVDLELEVKTGKIGRTKGYKYVGDW